MIVMKIQNQPPQPAATKQIEKSAAKQEAGTVSKKKAAAKSAKGDTVELTASTDAELAARQAEQAQRVKELKGLVQSGNYRVDARDVAEKMVSRSSRR